MFDPKERNESKDNLAVAMLIGERGP